MTELDSSPLIDRVLRHDPSLAHLVDTLARPCARMQPDGVPTSTTQSYVGGRPFLPTGASWPTDDDRHELVFLAQVNFQEVPHLGPGWPRDGLLQWFCGDDDTYGLDWDDAGQPRPEAGGFVRWVPAQQLGSPEGGPDGPVPEAEFSPLLTTGPVAVRFRLDRDLPSFNEVYESGGERWEALADAYDELSVDDDFSPAGGDKVGGWPNFVQAATFPASERPAARAVLQLDAETGAFSEWGDVGCAHVVGVPSELAEGDLSSFVWDWACY